VTLRNDVLWDITPRSFCKNRRFVATYRLHHQGVVLLRSLLRLLDNANAVPNALIFVTLMKEALISFETYVPTRATRRNVPDDGIIQTLYL
jgi:hypothetical protein